MKYLYFGHYVVRPKHTVDKLKITMEIDDKDMYVALMAKQKSHVASCVVHSVYFHHKEVIIHITSIHVLAKILFTFSLHFSLNHFPHLLAQCECFPPAA